MTAKIAVKEGGSVEVEKDENEERFGLPRDISRYLISSPAHFTGIATGNDWRLDHAWSREPHAMTASLRELPTARNFFVFSIGHEPWTRQSVVTPPPPISPRVVADVAAVFFGKQFVFHGPLEEHGSHNWPYVDARPLAMPSLGPYGRKPRPDLSIPLQLGAFSDFFGRILDSEGLTRQWLAAAHYYNRGLVAFNDDPVQAYLELVCSLEILASSIDFPEQKLLDEELQEDLAAIRNLPGGDKIASRVKGRLYQLRRRVGLLAEDYQAPRLFKQDEPEAKQAALQPDTFVAAMKAAYDVRSKQLHGGTRTPGHLTPHRHLRNEMMLGKPVIEADAEFAKILAKAPTFAGLERATRFILLSYCHCHVGTVAACLHENAASEGEGE